MNKPSPKFSMSDDWATLIAVLVFSDSDPDKLVGYVFIKDKNKKPVRWKLPGGKKEKGETPAMTASRELFEETGLYVPPDKIKQLPQGHQWRATHWSLLYSVRMLESQTKTMHSNHPENEGEIPKLFRLNHFEEIRNEYDFLEPHLEKMNIVESYLEAGLI